MRGVAVEHDSISNSALNQGKERKWCIEHVLKKENTVKFKRENYIQRNRLINMKRDGVNYGMHEWDIRRKNENEWAGAHVKEDCKWNEIDSEICKSNKSQHHRFKFKNSCKILNKLKKTVPQQLHQAKHVLLKIVLFFPSRSLHLRTVREIACDQCIVCCRLPIFP